MEQHTFRFAQFAYISVKFMFINAFSWPSYASTFCIFLCISDKPSVKAEKVHAI